MSGVLLMLTKDNVTIGIEWRFGPDWPGQRCGAKIRRGTSCQRTANKKNGRCRLHGEASTGAKTEEGLARISAANLRHGKFTQDKLEKRLRCLLGSDSITTRHHPSLSPLTASGWRGLGSEDVLACLIFASLTFATKPSHASLSSA